MRAEPVHKGGRTVSIEDYGARVARLETEIAALKRDRDECKARVQELEKDRARLDWIETGRKHISWNSYGFCWIVQEPEQIVGNIGKSSTAREAIDAAMKEAK